MGIIYSNFVMVRYLLSSQVNDDFTFTDVTNKILLIIKMLLTKQRISSKVVEVVT